MTTHHHPSRLRLGWRRGRRWTTTQRKARENELAELVHVRSWRGFAVSAQMPTAALAAGRLPTLTPGEVHDLAPVLSVSWCLPIEDLGEYYSDCDPSAIGRAPTTVWCTSAELS